MADLLDEYKEGLRTEPQEIVVLNKDHLVRILTSMSSDLKNAYDTSQSSDVDRILQKARGKLDVLLMILKDSEPEQ